MTKIFIMLKLLALIAVITLSAVNSRYEILGSYSYRISFIFSGVIVLFLCSIKKLGKVDVVMSYAIAEIFQIILIPSK
jgi:hypothetical protein